jgi:hypothetical protein
VENVTLLSKQCTPKDMVGIGTNFASLKNTYPSAKAMGSAIDSRVYVDLGNKISARIDANATANKEADLPDQVTVQSITVK